MATTTDAGEVWRARIGPKLASQLRADADTLGLSGRADVVKAGLELLHGRAVEERLCRAVDEFYEGAEPALPIGVLPADADYRS